MAFKVALQVRGLNDEAFREAFSSEEQCRAALVRLRWPSGFVCPAYSHRPVLTDSGPRAARVASFKWVNTTLDNIKSAITGTYRKLGPDHAERYLVSLA